MDNTRKVELQDIGQLAVLFDAYRIFYHKKSDVPGAEFFLRERIENKDSEIFIAENNDGAIVGFIQLYPLFSSTRMQRYWLLNDLYIVESSRGKGYSKRLIEKAKELAKLTNACGILLETGKENHIGNQLYPSCGFELYNAVNFYEWRNPGN